MARSSIKNRQQINATPAAQARRRRSLNLTPNWGEIELEHRQLMATYYVDNFTDTNTGSGNNGTLRWAVAQANAHTGDDIIQFSSSSLPQTITLTAANGPIIIKDTTNGNLAVNGLGQSNLMISGGNVTGLFLVKSPTSISNLTMTNGNGAGTLGGAKSGGAILNISCLTLDRINIYDSSVNNGYGGAIASGYGGSDYPNDLTANVRLVASNLVISNTSASGSFMGYGGAIYSGAHNTGTSTTTILIDSRITDTFAKSAAGAINHQTGYFGGTANLVISNLTMANTSSNYAGGILIGSSSNSNVTIDRLQSDKSNSGTGGLISAEMYAGANKTFISISNSTVSNANAAFGGAFWFTGIGNINIRDSVFNNTTASENGGLIAIDSKNATIPSILNISNISVNNTTANFGGGIYAANSITTINRINITKATASQAGGGIYNTAGIMTISNATMSFGVADRGGSVFNGGVNATSCVTINDSNITDSRGSISNYASNATAYMYVNRTSVQRGYGYDGGAILNIQEKGFAITEIDRSYFANDGNCAIENRGAYYGTSYYAKLTLSNSIVENNAGENGPVFSNGYTGNAILSISNTTIRNNAVYGDGGGLTVIGHYGISTATVENSIISNNQANLAGGGIRVFGINGNVNLVVRNTTITQNKSNTTGGGILVEYGSVSIANSTIYKNSAIDTGGGVSLSNGTISISQSTISDNTANLGGAIYSAGATAGNSNVFLSSATVANNNATIGGGVYDANSTRGNLSFYNSIVANNTASSSDSDVKGTIDISQYSLYSSNVSITSNTSSLLNTNPMLGTLGDNGGVTQTIPILSGSPAIGNANASVYGSMDQRGYIFATSDIGAFAYNGISNKLLVSSTANSGAGSLRDAIAFAATNPGDDTITFFPSLQNGTILLTSPITINDATGSVTINGLGQSNLTISGGNTTGIFEVRSNTTISNLAIRYGKYQTIGALRLGGSIYNDHSTLNLNNVTIVNSSSEYGGAIYNDGYYGNATLSINNSTLSDNYATYYGGAISNDSRGGNTTIAINNSTFARNTASSLGGAIFNLGRSSGKADLLISNSSLSNNNAPGNGGALYLDFSNLVMTGSTLKDNKSGGNGGAVTTDGGMATFTSTQFISNSSAGNGGAIDTGMNNATVLITDSLFQSNLAPNAGGAIGHGVGSLAIENSTFQYNRATNFGGGAIFSLSGYKMSNSTLAYNNTTGSGGALYLDRNGAVAEPNVSIANTTFSYNTANASGGGIYNNSANLTLNGVTLANHSAQYGGGIYNRNKVLYENTTIKNNNVTYYGGGIYDYYGTTTLANSTIQNNNASYGGGIIAFYGTTTLANSTIQNNNATNSGGGIYSSNGTTTLANSTIQNNNASYGGGIIAFYGTTTLANSTIQNNNATYGGGMYGRLSTTTLTNSKMLNNNATYGGAMYHNNVTTTLTNSVLQRNTSSSSGGALYLIGSNATTNITNSTLANNTANLSGGAIFQDSGSLGVNQSTVAYNMAVTGGGIYAIGNTGNATVSILQSTIARNSANSGGGITNANASGILNAYNSIIADNLAATGDSNVDGQISSSVNSLYSTSPLINSNQNSILNLNPLLAVLGYYGGSTPTMPPLPGSPAIAAGSNVANVPSVDQRGFARGISVDIGSVQTQGFTVSNITGSGQTATINANFTNPLGFQVTANNALDPVAGGVIRFTTPATGASGSFNGGTNTGVIVADGSVFSPVVRANLIVGSYQVVATASGLPDQTFSLNNAAPTVTAFIVQKGSVGRSFVRYVDLAFNTTATLGDIVASIGTGSPRIRMTNTGLDGTATLNYSLANKIAAVDAVLAMDFGLQGIGGDRNAATGDGSYLIEMDLDGNGSFETSRRFFRLLGDVNGDKVVDALDANIVAANIGATGSNVAADINGDGVVNAADTLLVRRQKGRKITI